VVLSKVLLFMCFWGLGLFLSMVLLALCLCLSLSVIFRGSSWFDSVSGLVVLVGSLGMMFYCQSFGLVFVNSFISFVSMFIRKWSFHRT
jgi:hypothetical protein